MKYEKMVEGIFVNRPNRFIAHVEINGQEEIVHVKNTGRCRELLLEGVQVWCQRCDKPNRKTKYDLISVQKGDRLINMDSQAPNVAVGEWLCSGGFGEVSDIRSEFTYGRSRFDFTFVKDGKQCFMEVKGVTLENNGVCSFPDAPTIRGAKHLQELACAVQAGYDAYVLFVIQMEKAKYLHPNDITDPAFGEALRQATTAGVTALAMNCKVTKDSMELYQTIPIQL